MTGAEFMVTAIGVWFGVGALVGLLFVSFGVSQIDSAAKGTGFFFRLAIFPGCMMLWPAVVVRLLSGVKINQTNEEEK